MSANIHIIMYFIIIFINILSLIRGVVLLSTKFIIMDTSKKQIICDIINLNTEKRFETISLFLTTSGLLCVHNNSEFYKIHFSP